jgi:hypothetical protein
LINWPRDQGLRPRLHKEVLSKITTKMKQLKLFVAVVALILASGTTYATTYTCIVSPEAEENTGHCRVLSSGNGSMCFTFGIGPACASTQAGGGIGV